MNNSSKNKGVTYGNSFFKSSSSLLSKISPLSFIKISIKEFNIGFSFQRCDSIILHQIFSIYTNNTRLLEKRYNINNILNLINFLKF